MRRKVGFTLVELIAVLAIIGTGASLFFSTFLLNWEYFEKEVVRVNLQQEATEILAKLCSEVRFAQSVDISADSKTLTISYPTGNSIVYTFTSSGQLQRTEGTTTTIVCEDIDYNNSSFTQGDSNSLIINLKLIEDVFGESVNIVVSTQLFPRNSV